MIATIIIVICIIIGCCGTLILPQVIFNKEINDRKEIIALVYDLANTQRRENNIEFRYLIITAINEKLISEEESAKGISNGWCVDIKVQVKTSTDPNNWELRENTLYIVRIDGNLKRIPATFLGNEECMKK
jgi:hypothetical protein